MSDPLPDESLPVSRAAQYLSVPSRWLRNEVEAGRLPGLRAGRVILVHVPTIANLLNELAKGGHVVVDRGAARGIRLPDCDEQIRTLVSTYGRDRVAAAIDRVAAATHQPGKEAVS